MLKTKKVAPVLTALMVCAVSSQIAFADYGSGTRNGGGHFNAYYDPSILQYGYEVAMDAGRTSWNGISSKVSIAKLSGFTDTTDRYYAGTTQTAYLYGSTVRMKNQCCGLPPLAVSESSAYDLARVSIYDNEIRARGHNNAFDAQLIAAHEVGHTLNMQHTTDSNYIITSLMTDGSNNSWLYNSPTTYDKGQLKSKWGN